MPSTLSRPLALIAAAAGVLAGCAGEPRRVPVPAAIAAPSQQALAAAVPAKGVQIYECRVTAQKHEWAFVAHEAELFDADGQTIGQHGAGPHWTFDRGARINGRVTARTDATEPGAIPWLLLETRRQPGSGSAPARLEHTGSIQRINTSGGAAPSEGCDAFNVGRRVRVPYTADYLFYIR